jgi:hypothetical protein
MVKQYPHTLRTTKVVSPSVQDPNTGDWTPGATAIVNVDCRAEVNDEHGWLTATDGSRVDYNWTVYLPLSSDTYNVGSQVEILDGATVIANDTIKRFHKGQLNMRIWL